LFDGQFSSIVVPDGAGLNEVLELLEQFTVDTVTSLNLNYTLNVGNCLGLPAGTYGYNQMFDYLVSAICNVQLDITDIQGDITDIQADITTIEGDITTLQTDITNIEIEIGDTMPLGSMIMFPVAAAPNPKWFLCEGQTLSTITYGDLFAVIGYTFGGSGPSFKLPDMQGKFLAGYDSAKVDYQVIGQGAGSDSVALSKAEIPTHDHILDNGVDGASFSESGSHAHSLGRRSLTADPYDETGTYFSTQQSPIDNSFNTGPNGLHRHAGNTGDGTTDGLSGAAHENRPEFIVFPWIIKVLV
jgi:microcystin-dependent protein